MFSIAWKAVYNKEVFHDLERLETSEAGRALKIVECQLLIDPLNLGVSLETNLPGCRLFKYEDFQYLYQVDTNRSEVYILVIRQESGLSSFDESQKAKTHQEVGQ